MVVGRIAAATGGGRRRMRKRGRLGDGQGDEGGEGVMLGYGAIEV
jgi:hypothetical protein